VKFFRLAGTFSISEVKVSLARSFSYQFLQFLHTSSNKSKQIISAASAAFIFSSRNAEGMQRPICSLSEHASVFWRLCVYPYHQSVQCFESADVSTPKITTGSTDTPIQTGFQVFTAGESKKLICIPNNYPLSRDFSSPSHHRATNPCRAPTASE
jgi:hypothetical protein